MNIGIFSDTYFPQLNGVATSIRTLTHALREKGHTVYIFTPSDPRCEGQPEDEDIFRLPAAYSEKNQKTESGHRAYTDRIPLGLSGKAGFHNGGHPHGAYLSHHV